MVGEDRDNVRPLQSKGWTTREKTEKGSMQCDRCCEINEAGKWDRECLTGCTGPWVDMLFWLEP